MMLFTMSELGVWLGLTVLEMWIDVLSLIGMTFMLVFRSDEQSWWITFFPLFLADSLNAYLCLIVVVRAILVGQVRTGLLRACWRMTFLALLVAFKVLLVMKLQNNLQLEYSEVVSPIFILLQLFAARACQAH